MSDQNFNKFAALIMIVVVLAAGVIFGLTHTPVPDFVMVLLGTITGFISHALGTSSGATIQKNGNGNGQSPH